MKPKHVLILVVLALIATAAALFLTQGDGKPQGAGTAGPATAAKPEDQPGSASPDLSVTERSAPTSEPTKSAPSADTDESNEPSTNRVAGRVIDSQDKPVQGATVKLSQDALMGEALAMDHMIGRTPTGIALSTSSNEKGEYAFLGVDPGRNYYVLASHAEYASVQEEGLHVTPKGAITVPDLVLRAGSICKGTVTASDGLPVADALVALDSPYMMGFDMESPDRLTAKTDGNGNYEFRNVSPGARVISCWADGFETQIHHDLNFAGTAGEELVKDFKLAVGAPIAGRVLGPESEPVVGARIIAINYGSNTSSRGEAISDDTGGFLISNLAQGSYILHILAKGYRQARQNRVQVGDVNLEINMIRQNTLTGRVFDVATHRPIEAFQVQLLHVNTAVPIQGSSTVSYEPTQIKEKGQPDGSFTLVGVDPGLFAVKVTAKGYASRVSDNFQVSDNTPLPPIEIGLSKGGTIRGRVVDGSGKPLSGVQVSSKDGNMAEAMFDPMIETMLASPTTERKAQSGEDGFFELKLLNPGRYRLLLEHPSFTSSWVSDINVVESQTADVGSVQLKTGGKVTGRVLEAGGQPATRAIVRLFSMESSEQYQSRTNADGRYTIEHVRPGLYRMNAMRSSGSGSQGDPFDQILEQQNTDTQVQVGEGQTLERDLSFGG